MILEEQLINIGLSNGVAGLALILMYRLFSTHLAENTKALNKLEALLNRMEGKLNG